MASYSRSTVTTTRVVYTLPSPTNWAEISKAMSACQQELGEERARWDDVVTVEAHDDEIHLWFTQKEEAGRG